MSEKSYRIRTNINGGDNVLNVSLKQGVKTLNILSLEINPTDAYDVQTSDYGVIVGRVLANGAFGVPNVKVSVFIPISSEDERSYIMSNEYPYKTPQSKGIDGVKYNLLYRKAGTFPGKRMVLDNDGCIEMFDKYWKYTATTNQSGDYMLFGVPTGSTQVHFDCDLSDIGILSQHPYDFIAKGYNANLFKSKTEFLDNEVGRSVHIISQDKTVYVYPFWGDKNGNKIGITRNDIDINYKFEPSCVFLGSVITDQDGSYIGVNGEPNGANGRFDSLATSAGNIEVIRKTIDGSVEELKDNVVGIIDGNGVWCYQIPMNLDRIGMDEEGNIIAVNDPERGIPTRARVRFRISLTGADSPSNSEYTAKMLVPCNPRLEHVNSSNALNVHLTETVKMEPVPEGFTYNYSNDKYELPNDYESIYEFGSKTPDSSFRDMYWGKVYSIKQYYPRFQYDYDKGDIKSVLAYNSLISFASGEVCKHWLIQVNDNSDKTDMYDFTGYPPQYTFKQSCISSIHDLNGINTFPYTTLYLGAEVGIDSRVPYWYYWHITDYGDDEKLTDKGIHFAFENDWVNGCLYFPRVIIRKTPDSVTDYFGSKTDAGGEMTDAWYEHVYISGRHHWHYNDGHFRVLKPQLSVTRESDDELVDTETCMPHNECVFSRVGLHFGIVTKKKTMTGAEVFYYRCGGMSDISDIRDNMVGLDCDFYSGSTMQMVIMDNNWEYGLMTHPSEKQGEGDDNVPYRLNNLKVYRRLYSTDIILLGNLEDIYDHLPKLFERLPDTTAIFPPVAPPLGLSESGMSKCGYHEQIEHLSDEDDDELRDIFDNYEDIADNPIGYNTEYGKALYNTVKGIYTLNTAYEDGDRVGDASDYPNWKRFLVQLGRRYSLFFGLKIHEVEDMTSFDIPTFVNSSRLCELDVHNDSAFKFSNVEVVPVNGMIDLYDISTNENRSAFATMNYDIDKYIINSFGNRLYVPTQLVINGFEGRLSDYIDMNYFGYSGSISHSLNNTPRQYPTNYPRYAIDDEDKSYTEFRFNSPNGNKTPFIQTEYHNKYDYYTTVTRNMSGVDNIKTVIPNNGALLRNESDDTNVIITITYNDEPNTSTRLFFGDRVNAPRNGHDVKEISFSSNKGKLGVYSRWYYDNSSKGLWYRSYCHGPLYLPENSFYFYFGLRNGFSALDALKERYTGKLNDEVSVAEMVTASQIEGAFECKNGGAYYMCQIDSGQAKLPIEWEIYMGVTLVNYGIINSREDCIIKDLVPGTYNFIAKDGDGKKYSSAFPINEIQINVSYEAYNDIETNMPMLYFNATENAPISQESHPIPNGQSTTMYNEYLFLSGMGDVDYFTKFSATTAFSVSTGEVVNGDYSNVTFTFPQGTTDVDVVFMRSDSSGSDTCIMSERNIVFNDLPGQGTFLNDVPVKYLRDWIDSDDQRDFGQNTPDSIYDNLYFSIFDSVNALNVTSDNSRGFKFEQFYDTKEKELSYISYMFSAICGDSSMLIYSTMQDSGFNMMMIGPNLNNRVLEGHYFKPYEKWGTNTLITDLQGDYPMLMYVDSQMVSSKDAPYIVGSNYPRSLDSRTLLMSGDSVNGYVSNELFYANYGTPNQNECCINLFALKSKTSSEYDMPGSNIVPSGYTENVQVSDVHKYYGVRTVDKRLDYQFTVTTPLVLPSGYESFPNLENRSLTEANATIDLYGGIRLNYSGSTKDITCYDYVSNKNADIIIEQVYEKCWIEKLKANEGDEEERFIINYKKSGDGEEYAEFSGNSVTVFDVSQYSTGLMDYVIRFDNSIGISEPSREYADWESDAAGVYLSYAFMSGSTVPQTIPGTGFTATLLDSSRAIVCNSENYLNNLNKPVSEAVVRIPVGSTYLVVSSGSTQSDSADILSGFPTLIGKPDFNAELYNVSASEYYTDTNGEISSVSKVMDEDKKLVWYEDSVHDVNEDVDHVIYTASEMILGTDMFEATFTSCSPRFEGGHAQAGDTASVVTTYKSGVSIVRHSGSEYDIRYIVNLAEEAVEENDNNPISETVTGETEVETTESETEPITGSTVSPAPVIKPKLFGMRNVRAVVEDREVFATLSGSSLEITINTDSSWNGDTFTDIKSDGEGTHNGIYPEWADSSDWEGTLSEKMNEMSLCVCSPSVGSNTRGFNVIGECGFTAEFDEGITYDGSVVISAVSGSTPLNDSEISDKATFILDSDLEELSMSGDTFIIIPTRKVYTTPDNPTLLRQGVVKNMGYVYFAGSIFVSKYETSTDRIITLRLNTPINDAENATNLQITNQNIVCEWHTIGKVDTETMTSSVGTITYSGADPGDDGPWTFRITIGDFSVDSLTVYFSIINGLRYRVDIRGLNA